MSYKILRAVVVLIFFIKCCVSQCVIGQNRNQAFTVVKKFGFKEIILRNDFTNIELDVGEDVYAYCDVGFRDCNKELGTSIELHCTRDYRNVKYTVVSGSQMSDFSCFLSCPRSNNLQLYESRKKLANCDPHTSLALGYRASPSISRTYAAICYDWNRLELKYINYEAYKPIRRENVVLPVSAYLKFLPTQETSLQSSGELKSVTMDKRIPDFESYFKFMSKDSFEEKYKVLQRNYSLLELFTFEYDSLVQDQPMAELSEPYAHLLNIIWWENLRLGNWRTFLKLLEERSAAVEYSAVTGTDGAVVVPDVRGACEANVILEVAAEDAGSGKIAAPEYIWTHLKAVPDNETDDFVVIAYNSPFYTKEDSIIFCQDMCDEIPWFHRFLRIRLMPARGLMFCCRPNEVANKLKNFPHLAGENADRLRIPRNTTTETAHYITQTSTLRTTKTTSIPKTTTYNYDNYFA